MFTIGFCVSDRFAQTFALMKIFTSVGHTRPNKNSIKRHFFLQPSFNHSPTESFPTVINSAILSLNFFVFSNGVELKFISFPCYFSTQFAISVRLALLFVPFLIAMVPLTYLTLFALLSLTVYASDSESIPSAMRQANANAANCTNVKIPPRLCIKCHLRPHDSRGNFFTEYTKDIIDIDTPECAEQIRKYIALNPCDTQRARHFAEYKTNRFAYERVAQFMYSVCEQCCDMVTVGAKPSEWLERKKANTLHTLTRGNGPAHLHYDICKMFPNLKRFTGPDWKVKETLPKICPLAADWMASDYSKWWSANADADGIPRQLVFRFGMMERLLGCTNRRVWQDCVRLERAQGRV